MSSGESRPNSIFKGRMNSNLCQRDDNSMLVKIEQFNKKRSERSGSVIKVKELTTGKSSLMQKRSNLKVSIENANQDSSQLMNKFERIRKKTSQSYMTHQNSRKNKDLSKLTSELGDLPQSTQDYSVDGTSFEENSRPKIIVSS